MGTVSYNNESDKRVANCDYLNNASISQNDEEPNVGQCKLEKTDEFSEESDLGEGNSGLVDIDDAAVFVCTLDVLL